MTFILAIQLKDSAIVASDHQSAILHEDGFLDFSEEKIRKMHYWEEGMITGSGEYHVVQRAFEIFSLIACSNIQKLPECLEISRRARELEVGTDYSQIQRTKLLCSRFTEQGAQLYTVGRLDHRDNYTMTAIEPMKISLWMFNPDVSAVITDLQYLFDHLRNYSSFKSLNDWFEYYIPQIARIYKKQSKHDAFMSESFDIYFQNKENYYSGPVPNRSEKIAKISIL
ncbi:hypothetical protein [Acinetobacter bereziniae]|uniref:hypothetical protein n=2 Tax=Acinetobacter bereziniae TaxID=106648 RepID=UPI00124E9BAD|nr:hypothetical protein [Acinetobacter bereziniae]MBI0396201.1 hypothetical protein [Acinetobacter bereziniae]MBJ8454086.1 hypothetical protein [Acinetobacter bereziniae]MBJ8455253.1 hypothetical protein [Acinetobacter bereziniae]MBJ8551228.1 hypothetical protein [Acinetobacter bereziniae]MBJ9905285.1 hypothetical protein [Acinetobacter bereziniae]